jgi:hypothetical protein
VPVAVPAKGSVLLLVVRIVATSGVPDQSSSKSAASAVPLSMAQPVARLRNRADVMISSSRLVAVSSRGSVFSSRRCLLLAALSGVVSRLAVPFRGCSNGPPRDAFWRQ